MPQHREIETSQDPQGCGVTRDTFSRLQHKQTSFMGPLTRDYQTEAALISVAATRDISSQYLPCSYQHSTAFAH